LIGNTLFASHHAFKGNVLSRRDDIISVVNLVTYFFDDEIHWARKIDP
jgi:hypothetical protein